MLCAAPISAVAGTKLPGPGSIYLSQTLQFRRPVFVGDTVTAYVKVTEIKDAKRIVAFDTNVYNQNDELVISGQALVKVTEDKITKNEK
jgi:3-hydroxybutyryl-CoA dehydratase